MIFVERRCPGKFPSLPVGTDPSVQETKFIDPYQVLPACWPTRRLCELGLTLALSTGGAPLSKIPMKEE
jgi:hypothetical protein